MYVLVQQKQTATELFIIQPEAGACTLSSKSLESHSQRSKDMSIKNALIQRKLH